MMHTSYCTSILSLRSYTAFNDYSCYYSNETYPSTYCSCCSSFPINSCKLLLPINPNLLYGSRQSTLIHCPPSRRFLLGSNDRYRCRASVYDVGRCCCFESCCVKQDRVGLLGRRKCENKGFVRGRSVDVSKVKGRMGRPSRCNLRVYGVGDAEAMLSLLSEEIVEECVVLREKKKRSLKCGEVVSKQNVVIEELRDGNEDVRSVYRESKPKSHRLESGMVRSRDEGRRRKEERCNISKEEDQRLRRRESGSSYCSVSESGDFGSDIEVEIEQEQFVGESSTSHKDSRKSEGVVITEEAKQNWGNYRDDKDQELRSSRRDDQRIGCSIQQNWRKKSEKKFTEESEESKIRNESALRQSQLSQAKENSAMISSNLKKQFDFQEEQSISDVKSHGQSSARIQIDNRASEYLKSSIENEDSTQKRRENIETTSTSWRSTRRKEHSEMVDMSAVETGCEYCKTCGKSMEERKTQSDFQQKAEQLKMRVDAKLTKNAESMSENRLRRQEKGSCSLQSSVAEESKQHGKMHMATGQASAKQKSEYHLETISSSDSRAQNIIREQQFETRMQSMVENSRTSAESQSESRRREEKMKHSIQTSAKEEERWHGQINLETGQVDARRKSEHYSVTMDDDDGSFSRSNLRSQLQSETRIKQLEEKTTSLSAAEELKRLREESGKVSDTEIGHSRVHSSDLEINRQSISDKRVYNEQIYSKEKVQSLEELVEKRKRIEETVVQSTLKTEIQGQIPGEATISQPSGPSISRIVAEELSGQETKSEQLSVTSPTYQYGSQFPEASGSGMRNNMGRIIEVGSGTAQIHLQSGSLSSYSEVDDNERNSGEGNSPEGALVSSARMHESAALIIGEFVEQMSHEASTSDASSEKKNSKLDLKHPDEKHSLKRSPQSDIDNSGLQVQGSELSSQVFTPDSGKKRSQIQDSKHLSPDSLTKGSSDQMGDIKDHFVQEVSKMKSAEGATSETAIAVRSGKSLWNFVADICRLRWGTHSENQKSPVKKRSSPTGSAGSETWFSGDDVDEANGNGVKAEKIGLLREGTSDQSLMLTTTTRKDRVSSLEGKLGLVDVGASSSSGGAVVGENTDLNIPQLMSLSSPSVGLSIPSARELKRSLAFEELDEEEKEETPVSSSEEQRDYFHEERQSDVSLSEGTDVSPSEGGTETDSKRRLQRSKLVLQRFDEWEDAYKREREQRKVDEIFMREALSEAIKAGDSWEVPVGAVLVQNGKIIARGYNLVEELRDSTAHAEMICIREASNFLRSWRLSETTLYVTLEPCPMCAGAILQARISTLVWGAPNKLLGADGSWIRLFPEGLEGDERSEVVDKPAAPIHPFHPKMNIRRGILQEECADIMQQFFQLKRRKAKPKATPSEEPDQPTCFPKPKHKSKLLYKMHNVFHPSNPTLD